MTKTKNSANINDNKPSWTGMGEIYPSLFKTMTTGARRAFGDHAVYELTPAQPASIMSLMDYDKKRPNDGNLEGTYSIDFTNRPKPAEGFKMPLGHPEKVALRVKRYIPEEETAFSSALANHLNKSDKAASNGITFPNILQFGDGRFTRELNGYHYNFVEYHDGHHINPKQYSAVDAKNLGKALGVLRYGLDSLPEHFVNRMTEFSQPFIDRNQAGYRFHQQNSDKISQILSKYHGTAGHNIFTQDLLPRFREAERPENLVPCHSGIFEQHIVINGEGGVHILDFENIAGGMNFRGLDESGVFRILLKDAERPSALEDYTILTTFLNEYNQYADIEMSFEELVDAMAFVSTRNVVIAMGLMAEAENGAGKTGVDPELIIKIHGGIALQAYERGKQILEFARNPRLTNENLPTNIPLPPCS